MISGRERRCRGSRLLRWQNFALVILLQFPASLPAKPASDPAFSPPDRVLVVSDVDDTIKDTHVTLLDSHLRNPAIVFDGLRPWQAVPGMARLYQDWKKKLPARFHYLSAGPVRYERRFKGFLAENGFPDGLVSLRAGGNLLASHEYKTRVLVPILAADKKQLVVFVGDSGERDPESYGELARRFPRQVLGIFIRQVTAEARSSPRYQKAFAGVPASRWTLFRRPAEIAPIPWHRQKDRKR
jgi:phosphatidate phosphatase APP1